MNSYKTRTIKAIKSLIKYYRNTKFNRTLMDDRGFETCPLCKIYKDHDCGGCVSCSVVGNVGCGQFKSYQNFCTAACNYVNNKGSKQELIEVMEIRAQFWEKYLPRIEKKPEAQFNPKTWTPFKLDTRK